MKALSAARSTTMTVNPAFFDTAFELFEVESPVGSIGGDVVLRYRIEEALRRLGEARVASFGDAAYSTTIASLKRDFGINKRQPWTMVWGWPAHRGAEILNYLEGRYAEAVGGH